MDRRARLERALNNAWLERGAAAWSLRPLAAVYALARSLHRVLYQSGWLKPWSVGLPVVVVGNLYAGGTGKTPLVIELVRALAARGWRPGVISRGYRSERRDARPVRASDSAEEAGDEPLLIAQATGAPVVIGADRVAAARVLRSLAPQCNLIVCDDGLQHIRLARDFEIAVLHFRGLGNGWLLPAGPLRDPPERLRSVDAVVRNGEVPAVRIYSPVFSMRGELDEVYALADPRQRAPLAKLVLEQRTKGVRVAAAAGIGAPERFFAMLREAGLDIEAIALPDHHDFKVNPFAGRTFDVALMTEKDAVKCRRIGAIVADGRMCVVSLRTTIEPGLIDLIESRIKPRPNAAQTSADGLSPA